MYFYDFHVHEIEFKCIYFLVCLPDVTLNEAVFGKYLA